jgi:hypothetical protein
VPLCFEVQVNDEQPIVAGMAGIGVLTAIVAYASARDELDVQVGGLVGHSDSGNEHVDWIERDLKPGDRVIVRIVDSSEPTPPTRRHREEPGFEAAEERRYYELLKKKYEQ